jgi:lipopolysaccharide export system permease protein
MGRGRAGPMGNLSRYIFGQLGIGMTLVTLGLTCVIWLVYSLRLIDLIVNRGISTGTFLYLTMLSLPNLLDVILPIALFAVVMFVYSKMITDREIVVMRAAGVSQMGLAAPALALTGLVIVLSYTLNLWLVPESFRNFKQMQWDIRYKYSHVLLQEGRFNHLGKGIVVYVRERSPDGQLLGILVHDASNPDQPYTMMAARGAMVETDDGARVVMFDGNRQEVSPTTGQMSLLYFDRSVFDLPKPAGRDGIRHREARERTVAELFDVENDAYLDPKNFGKFRVEGHKRLIAPVRAAGYAMLALACILSGAATRRTQWRRILVAVGVLLALLASAVGLENYVAKAEHLTPLLYVHAAAPLLIAWIVLIRPPRRRPPPDEPAGFAMAKGA